MAGWGKTEFKSLSNNLKEVQIPIHENQLCYEMCEHLWNFDEDSFSDSVICGDTLNRSQGSSIGDSGGPLMLPIYQNGTFPFYQIGVSAFTWECGIRYPSGYTSTQYYADWIQKMIKKEI